MLGLSLEDIGDAYTYVEAADLIVGLAGTEGTRTHASVQSWRYPLSKTDRMLQHLVEMTAAVHRDPKKQPQPVSLGWPWPEQSDVTEEEREALLKQLIARSALADR